MPRVAQISDESPFDEVAKNSFLSIRINKYISLDKQSVFGASSDATTVYTDDAAFLRSVTLEYVCRRRVLPTSMTCPELAHYSVSSLETPDLISRWSSDLQKRLIGV